MFKVHVVWFFFKVRITHLHLRVFSMCFKKEKGEGVKVKKGRNKEFRKKEGNRKRTRSKGGKRRLTSGIY